MALTPLPARRPGPHKKSALPEIIEPLCAVFRRTLRAEGLKYTPERAQVLDIITRHETLFDADTLQEDLKRAGFRVSKATVYRTIKLLQDAGIIQRVLADDDHASYQVVYGQRPHDLIIRVDTQETIAIDLPELIELRERLCAAHGLSAVGHKLQIFATARA